MDNQSPPEMYSVALSGGNKFTAGFRRLNITEDDWNKVQLFMSLIRENVVASSPGPPTDFAEPEVPMGNAGRVMRGHVPTETELARASEKIALRQNIQWITPTLEETRLQTIREKRASTNSSDESGESSQS